MRVLLFLFIMTTSALAAPQRDDDGHAIVIVVDRAMTAAKIESVRLAVKDTELSRGDQFGVPPPRSTSGRSEPPIGCASRTRFPE